MAVEHADALAELLCNAEVYRFIGDGPPSLERHRQRVRSQVSGPPPELAHEEWLNLVVRSRQSGELLGQLQATIHHRLAEVAFLFGPAHWGKGYAREALAWLNGLLLARPEKLSLWATALPANQRSCNLLRRCGYVEVTPPHSVRLLSYDEGDLVFRHELSRDGDP